ncbi:hypothetical protein GALL_503630 [mine drainage metagenome]|uniref:Uncharacterized protein n=1 Tax=mine drainage metagenome TaxID=410659 RepID=A0A1J5P8X0_9ZZZZ
MLSTTEDGLLAPVALILLLFGLYRLGRSVEKLDDTQESKVLGIGLSLATLAVVMVNLYGSRFVDGNLMSNFWIAAALAARYRSLVLESRAGVGQASETQPKRSRAAGWTPRPATASIRQSGRAT